MVGRRHDKPRVSQAFGRIVKHDERPACPMREDDEGQAFAITRASEFAITRSHHRDVAETNRSGFVWARIPDRDNDLRTACVSRHSEKLETGWVGRCTHYEREENCAKPMLAHAGSFCLSAILRRAECPFPFNVKLPMPICHCLGV